MALGLIAANYEEKISTNLLAPVKTMGSLYTTYNKFIPKDQLNNHIEKHMLTLMGSQFLVQFSSTKINKSQQDINHYFERLNDPEHATWGNLIGEVTNFAIFIFPYAVGQVFSNNIDHYFDRKLHVTLEEQIRDEIFSGETALRLSHDSNSSMLMDNLKNDISTMVDSGGGLTAGAISTAIGGIYGVGIIVVHSPNLFVYSYLYNKAQSFVADYLTIQRRRYSDQIICLDSKLTNLIKHDSENIRTITERDGIEVTQDNIRQISSDLRDLEGAQRLWSMANSFWWSVTGIIDHVSNYLLLGREINQGRIDFDSRAAINTANWKASSLLSWAGHQAQTISLIDQSLDRIIVLEGKLHLPLKSAERIDQIDRVLRKGNQLILQDVEIGIGDRMLVTIDDLKLDMDKIYAITGKAGCDKTSFLSKIKGIKENSVYGKGIVYYPEIIKDEKTEGRVPKIVMLSQQDYFPLDSSLYEIISYPDKAPNDPTLNDNKRKEISALLQEVRFACF